MRKRQMIRRLSALLLAVLMAVTQLPLEVYALMPGNEVRVVETGVHTLNAEWNDNADEHGVRPIQDDFSAGIRLYYSIDGGERVLLQPDNLAEVGLAEMPVIAFSASGGDGSYWTAKLTLPAQIQEYAPEQPEDSAESKGNAEVPLPLVPQGDPKPVQWSVAHDTVSGYLNAPVEETALIHTMRYAKLTEFEATLKWQDNGDIYNTRPGNDGYQLYRYLLGKSPADATAMDSAAVHYEAQGNDEWKITLEDLPEYDADGIPYVYFLRRDGDSIPARSGTDHYGILYDNKDNYASITDSLNHGGTAVHTLEGNGVFSVKKVWDDDNNPERPDDCALHLYRIAERTGGVISDAQIDRASPVQGYDNAVVPDTVPAGAEYVEITMGEDENGMAELPLYDAEGHRYVYFALETGLKGDYVREIDNRGSPYSDTVKDLFKRGNKYVLNGGKITNTRRGTVSLSASKVFRAQAMQSMEVAVQLTLQYYDQSEGVWKNVTQERLVKPEEIGAEKLEHLSLGADGQVIMTLDGFCSESRGEEKDGPTLLKYTDNGAEILYRWVETAMRMKVEPDWVPVTHHDVPGNVNPVYDQINLGNYAPGAQNQNTTALFQPEQSRNNEVLNDLVGKCEIEISKQWFQGSENISAAQEAQDLEAVFTITKDGVPLSAAEDGIDAEVKLSAADLRGDRWVKIIDSLERFDKNGKEYEYQVEEQGLSDWHVEVDVKRTVDTVDGVRIPKTTCRYTNSKGPGKHLIFDVKKEWLDEGDLLTRKPVKVALYRLRDDQMMEGTEQELNENNEYTARIDLQLAEDSTETVDDYLIKEVSINDIAINYSKTNAEIAGVQDGTGYGDARLAGKADEGENYSKLNYVYDVFISRNRKGDTRAAYCVSNRRTGTLTLNVSKRWVAGGTAPEATFEVLRSVSGGTPEVYETFGLVPTTPGALSAEWEHKSLPKYDEQGRQYLYTLVETKIGGVETAEVGSQRMAAVEGDTYVSTVYQDNRHIVGNSGHHSGDYYSWTSTNARKESYTLNAFKVWRDDGRKNQTARPDVHFDVYRVPADDETCFNDLTTVDAVADYCEGALTNNKAELVVADKLWNTKHNDWCWSCELGSVDRYDNLGNRYLYFLVEEYTGYAGEYSAVYCNATVKPRTDKNVTSTKEVLSKPKAEMLGHDLVVLSDGMHAGDNGCGDYYSRTVVNGRKKNRTLSGRKIWSLPTGWVVPAEKMPRLEIELYRTTEDVPANVTADHDAMKAAARSGDYGLEYVNQTELVNGGTQFRFKTDAHDESLGKYDEFGRTYHYYLIEATDFTEFSTAVEQVSTSGFTITNTYNFKAPNVKVTLSKLWKNALEPGEEDKMAPAKFSLYAQAVDAGGKPITKSPILMSTVIRKPTDPEEYTFEYYTEGDGANSTLKLPYYGPNGLPFHYYLTETKLPNGYDSAATTDGKGYDKDHIIELTRNADGDLYSGQVEYSNRYTGGTASGTLQKTWTGEDNNAGLDNTIYRPASIQIDLCRKWGAATVNGQTMAAGSERVDTITLTDAGGWKYTLPNTLPKYAPFGQAYTYYLEDEVLPSPNNQFYRGSKDGNNYENQFQTTKYAYKKLWTIGSTTDAQMAAQLRFLQRMGALPENMSFTLQRSVNGTAWEDVNTRTVAVAQSHKSTYEWYGLPLKDTSGAAYIYRVKETVGDFTFTSDQTSGSGKVDEDKDFEDISAAAEVTTVNDVETEVFTNEMELDTYSFRKVWEDGSNQDNTRPTGPLTIYVNGEEYSIPATANADVWTLENVVLPAAAEDANLGDLFTVTEENISGYQKIHARCQWDNANKCYTLTNGLTDSSRKTISLTATKIFEGDTGRDLASLRPTVGFSLYYQAEDGSWVKVDSTNQAQVAPAGTTVEPEKTVTIGSNGQGSVTWTGLLKYRSSNGVPGAPRPMNYKIVETLYAGGAALTQSGYTQDTTNSVVTGDTDNSHTSYTASITNNVMTTSVTAHKAWAGDDDDAYHYRDGVTLKLYRNGIYYDQAVANANNSWSVTFTGLAMYDRSGEPFRYTVREDANSAKAYARTDGNAQSGYTVTNTLIRRDITATKAWDDDWDTDQRPDAVTLVLKKDGVDCDEKIVTAAENWTAEFTDLVKFDKDGREFDYTVEEAADSAPAYTHTAADVTGDMEHGFTITNHLVTRDIQVTKAWDDDDGSDRLRASVEVVLNKSGTEYARKTLDADQNWTAAFTDLPRYNKDGTEVTYTVEEVAGGALAYAYPPEVTGNAEDGFTVTNSLQRTRVIAQKLWEGDNEDEEGLRQSVTIHLYRTINGEKVQYDEAQADAANGWQVVFDDLPRKDTDGTEFVYSVSEDPIVGYIGGDPIRVNPTAEELAEGPVAAKYEITNTYITGGFAFKKIGLINESCSEAAAFPPERTKLLEGAVFGLYDRESEELVMTAASDENGIVFYDKVRNGSYFVQEIEAPAPYVADESKYWVDLFAGVCTGLYTETNEAGEPIPMEAQVLCNDQARLDLSLVKVDEQEHTKLLTGARYGLYRVVASGDGEEYVLLKEAVTDENGMISLKGLLTGQTYVIRELEGVTGYYRSKEEICFDVVLNDERKAVIDNFDGGNGTAEYDADSDILLWNEPRINVSIRKVTDDGKESGVKGAKLQLKHGGKVLREWISEVTSDGESVDYEVNGILSAGENYTVHEVQAPEGYMLAEDVEFTIPADPKEANEKEPLEIKMVDPAEIAAPAPNADDSGKSKKSAAANTGDAFHPALYLALLVGALAGMILLSVKKREE